MSRRVRRAIRTTAASLVLIQALALSAFAAEDPFKGLWRSIDTDGSTQLLKVSGGATPSVTYQDFFASGCANNGSPSTHWVAAGSGEADGTTLFVQFHKSGCGAFSIGAYDDTFTYDAGTDTLTDSFGIVWSPAP